MDNVTQEEQTYRHLVWEWASEKGINYIDMLENDEELDFRSVIHHDGFHTYINGASFATDLLASYIKSNYEFDKHENNDFLNEKSSQDLVSYSLAVLKREINPSKYLYRFINSPSTILISYRRSDIDDNLRSFLDKMGLNELSNDSNYYAIIKKGEVIVSDSYNVDYELDGNNILINNDGIYFNGNLLVNDNSFSLVMFSDDYETYEIKIIDYLYKIIWDKGYDWGYNYVG